MGRDNLWFSRESLMFRAEAARATHLRTAALMQREVMTERDDNALPALATWEDVRSEAQQARVHRFVLLHLRRMPANTSLTGAEWQHIIDLARVRAQGPAWRARGLM